MIIFNKRLAKHCLEPFCTIITGDRGAGKSSVFALILQAAQKEGLKVYCQFPYKGCYQIPMIEIPTKEGFTYFDIDKKWLYTHDFKDCVLLIDEAKTVWPARGFKSWSMQDEQFFNFLRHNNIRLFIATQAYDGLDLNVKRAADEVWYLTKWFWHFTHIETSHTTLCKVADKQTEVQGRMFKKGMRKIAWDVCEVPLRNYHFWRKSYYGKFITNFIFGEKLPPDDIVWDNAIDWSDVNAKARNRTAA
ncbi:MAG: zonular occludens toxin domain-containing protein [Ruminococcus sp.]|nr:zonular occludens toxin domain-containing protein [Ruminococcus sp.]